MNRHNSSAPWSNMASNLRDISEQDTLPIQVSPALVHSKKRFSPFWHDRLIEAGLLLSMACYYLIANPNLHIHVTKLQNPLYSLPFLLIFALLAWYRLPFAVALLPFALPYYYFPKTVFGHAQFSMAEITLWTCVAIAGGQLLLKRRRWPYWLSWAELRGRVGPFAIPILVFLLAAAASIVIAYSRANALRAFREEVVGPLLYLFLALCCLRTRQDLTRLLVSLLGSGFVITLLGLVQYIMFKGGVSRITAVYGSGNDIGLFLDYTVPICLALVFSRLPWKIRLPALVVLLPFGLVAYGSDSRGSWLFALPLACLFAALFALRKRKQALLVCAVLALLFAGSLLFYHRQIADYVINGHINTQGKSTALKRPWLWKTALNMIHDSPWLGYGMDNWLCHYSSSYTNTCLYPPPHPPGWSKTHYSIDPHPKLHPYWILIDPATKQSTGLSDEPTLSHPHNIFLHVWVSIGIFGLLAFLAVFVLFFWLFAGLMTYLHKVQPPGFELLRWLTVGVGAAMVAALAQGQIDSAFLEQDLSFCFWTLVAALLLVRALARMPWHAMWPRMWRSSEKRVGWGG